MLPAKTASAICRRLRTTSSTPIIMLTAAGDPVARVVGLEMGADDYVAKPFNPHELLARIRAVLRRATALPDGPGAPTNAMRVCGLAHRPRRALTCESRRRARDLTVPNSTCSWLLRARAANADARPVARPLAGPRDGGHERSVDILVSRIRRKSNAIRGIPRSSRRSALVATSSRRRWRRIEAHGCWSTLPSGSPRQILIPLAISSFVAVAGIASIYFVMLPEFELSPKAKRTAASIIAVLRRGLSICLRQPPQRFPRGDPLGRVDQQHGFNPSPLGVKM